MDRKPYRTLRLEMGDHFIVTKIETLKTYATARAAHDWVDRNPHLAGVLVVDSAGYLTFPDGTRCLERPVQVGKQCPNTVDLGDCCREPSIG